MTFIKHHIIAKVIKEGYLQYPIKNRKMQIICQSKTAYQVTLM